MSEPDQEVVVAHCGLVCSKCGAFKNGKCEGCHSEKPMRTEQAISDAAGTSVAMIAFAYRVPSSMAPLRCSGND